MREVWAKTNKTPPRLLVNRANAAVLANHILGSEPTLAETRAEKVSKCGAAHARSLAGMFGGITFITNITR